MIKGRMKEARLKNHLTQEELAEKLGTEKNQISRWEQGHKIPRAERIAEIAQILNVSVDYLMGLSDEPTIRVRIDNLTVDEIALIVAVRNGERENAMRMILDSEKRPPTAV